MLIPNISRSVAGRSCQKVLKRGGASSGLGARGSGLGIKHSRGRLSANGADFLGARP